MDIENSDVVKYPGNIWQRGLYMLLFSFFLGIAKFVVFIIVVVQFLFVLFTDAPNEQLTQLGKGLSAYHYQVLMFLTFNSEEHAYPFAEWPQDK